MESNRTETRLVSCGCCTNGCVCWNHRDVPNGKPERECDEHRGWTRQQKWAAVEAYWAKREVK